MTSTVSPRLIRTLFAVMAIAPPEPTKRSSQIPCPAAHAPPDQNPGPQRVLLLINQDSSVLVERNVRAVFPTVGLLHPHHHGLHDLALLHRSAGDRFLHCPDNHVTNARIPSL